ncbi:MULTISPECIES: DnaJ domain-containing protein [unclassified Cyanobium]|uniref:DnaJ domain-containing protein n=1 Tax=unclassified Cyanobium TaxID=2627006 RepID=UPI0020CC84E6|nr:MULTISPECIES: DnaJ domain-containing protein [unclassified Cyanobium]
MTSSPAASADYWSVLGLEPGADASNLKRAFRAQARRWHPDLNGNDPLAEERFKLVNEAYAVLSDPRRRQAWEAGVPADGQGRESQDPFASGFPDFEAYLEVLFGERRRPRRAAEPEWQEPEPEPPAETPRQASGSVTAAPPPPPPVRASSDQESLVDLTPEQALQGERLELELADGTAVEVWTPPFAGDGWRLRLAGVTPGGGDHFLQLRVRTEEGLRIDGLRVLYPLELTPAEAALGCQVVVPTLRGPVKLRVPAGSSSGRLLRLRGRGQEWAEQRGDQLVEVRILVPEQLGEAEAALYKRLQELADDPDDQHR